MSKGGAPHTVASTNPFSEELTAAEAANGKEKTRPRSIFADSAPGETEEKIEEAAYAEEVLVGAAPDQAEYWMMRVGVSYPKMQALLDATMERVDKAFGPEGFYKDTLTQPAYHEHQAKDYDDERPIGLTRFSHLELDETDASKAAAFQVVCQDVWRVACNIEDAATVVYVDKGSDVSELINFILFGLLSGSNTSKDTFKV